MGARGERQRGFFPLHETNISHEEVLSIKGAGVEPEQRKLEEGGKKGVFLLLRFHTSCEKKENKRPARETPLGNFRSCSKQRARDFFLACPWGTRGVSRPARDGGEAKKGGGFFFHSLETPNSEKKKKLLPSSGVPFPVLGFLMDGFPTTGKRTGKRTTGLSSGSANPWKRVAGRLGNERRRASASAAAATTTTTAGAKGRPSDDLDIADLLLSFSRAPTKQVRDAPRGERAIMGSWAGSAGGGAANHQRRQSVIRVFFFSSFLLAAEHSSDERTLFW